MTRARAVLHALRDRLDPRPVVHFLHVGKTGGTQFAHVAAQLDRGRAPHRFRVHPHDVRLVDLPPDAPYVFGIRDPVTRFRSGFYSRKRQGLPRARIPWTPDEARAFERFPHANDLAEALFEPGPHGDDARDAIQAIAHTARHLVDPFMGCGFLFHTRPPVGILRQEHFADDLRALLDDLGVRATYALSEEASVAHRSAAQHTVPLSTHAVSNLRRWYVRDVWFHARCEAWIAQTRAGAPR